MAQRIKRLIGESYELQKQADIMQLLEHVVIIRFSVDMNRTEFANKLESLLSEERLDYRFKLFETYCLPSLLQQSIVDFKVIMLVDKNLPFKFVNRLNRLVINEHNFFVHYWKQEDRLESNEWLRGYLDVSKKFLCTTRMDDDDLIHKKSNELFKLCLYEKRNTFNKNSIYHLSSGIYVHIEQDETIFPLDCNNKSLAVFMSLVTPMNYENNIYYYSHDIIQKYPDLKQHHIMCAGGSLFGVTNHPWENDTRYKRFAKHKKNSCSLEEIYKKFEINK